MKCTICSKELKYENAKKNASTLRNHYEKQHRKDNDEPPKKVQKISDYFTASDASDNGLPNLPPLDRQAIAACCSRHVLPFDIVEDEVFQWAYSCSVKNRQRISSRVSEIAAEWRTKILEMIKNKFISVMLDGWKNPINGKHHLCYMLWNGDKVFYWSSVDLSRQTTDAILESLLPMIEELTRHGAKVIGLVADNARNIQSAIRAASVLEGNIEILTVSCAAHLLNLIEGDIFTKVSVAKDSIDIIDSLIKSGLLPRYSCVRWNSRYESVCKAINNDLVSGNEHIKLLSTKQLISQVAIQLMIVQSDGSNVMDVIESFKAIKAAWQSIDCPEDQKGILNEILERRWKMFTSSGLGMVVTFFNSFLGLCDFPPLTQEKKDQVEKWIYHMLPDKRHSEYRIEKENVHDSLIMNESLPVESFPVHRTLINIIKRVAVTEASVERAFSAHKMLHSRLRANLSTERLNDQLFIRYNCPNILNFHRKLCEDIENEILQSCDTDD
jgi:hypothetical protein